MSTRKFITDPAVSDGQFIEQQGDFKPRVKRKGHAVKPGGNSRGSKVDDELVSKFLEGQTGPITRGQVRAMSALIGRTPKTVRGMMTRARQRFIEGAERYVEIHAKATEEAYSTGDHETAIKAAQWAMSNLAAEGVRIVDKPEGGDSGGTKVLIGVQIGGIKEPKVLVKQIAPSTPLEQHEPIEQHDE